MNNKNKISPETIARTIILFLTLINFILTMIGKNPLPFADDDVYTVVSNVAAIAAIVWAWWKNNSFTSNAIEADKYLKELNNANRRE